MSRPSVSVLPSWETPLRTDGSVSVARYSATNATVSTTVTSSDRPPPPPPPQRLRSPPPPPIWCEILQKCRSSRKLILVIVAIGLLLDNMLLTAVVPIIPTYLLQLHHYDDNNNNNDDIGSSSTSMTTTISTSPTSSLDTNRQYDFQLLSKYFTTKCSEEIKYYLINNTATTTNTSDDSICSSTTTTTTTTTGDGCVGDNLIQTTLNTNKNPNSNRNRRPVLISSRTSMVSIGSMMTNDDGSSSLQQQQRQFQQQKRHQELIGETSEVGLMFVSKPVVQAITNMFVGPLTAKIGYSWPLFFGLILLFLSTMIFAVGSTYITLFLARSLQGVGSAFTSVAGMGILAQTYPDDRERGNCMAIALGGLALGVLIGPPFGGVMYEFIGQSSPFITLALFALLDGCLQLIVLQPEVIEEKEHGASLITLIQDPYILIAAGSITFANAGIAMLEPSLPIWMMDTMDSSNWEQGVAFLPASISYLIGTNVFGPLGHRMGRWLASLIGLVAIGCALLSIPLATNLAGLIIPNGMIGFAIGMVDSSMMPMLGYLVDIRHSSIYGSVYAIGDVALCIGYIIGPFLSGTLVTLFGFTGLCVTTACVCFAFAPLMFVLRNPPIVNIGCSVGGGSGNAVANGDDNGTNNTTTTTTTTTTIRYADHRRRRSSSYQRNSSSVISGDDDIKMVAMRHTITIDSDKSSSSSQPQKPPPLQPPPPMNGNLYQSTIKSGSKSTNPFEE